MVAPSRVPSVNAPFIMNFMLLVPLASYPAVEIWFDTSAAGMRRSAREALYSGRKTTFILPRIAGSPSMVPATLFTSLMMTFASQ